MSQVLDYVIIGLFAVFCLYFLYTLIDTFYFSKRRRHIRSKSSKKSSIEKELISDNSDTKNNNDFKENNDENTETSDELNTSSNDDSHESNDSEVLAKNPVVKDKEKKSTKSFFSGFKLKKPSILSNFSVVRKKQISNSEIDPVKVDDEYFDILKQFFVRTNGSWTKDKFHDFLSEILRKGYDKRPSEVMEDLELIRKEISEERLLKSKANFTDKDSELDDDIQSDDNKPKHSKKSDNELEESTVEDLKDAEKSIEEKIKLDKKDTRDELDKTLKEIREIRERLSKFE